MHVPGLSIPSVNRTMEAVSVFLHAQIGRQSHLGFRLTGHKYLRSRTFKSWFEHYEATWFCNSKLYALRELGWENQVSSSKSLQADL
jgi:hypothetical protein